MKDKVVTAIVASLLTTLIVAVLGRFRPDWIIGALDGATREQLSALEKRIDDIDKRTQHITASPDNATHVRAGSFQFSFHENGRFAIYNSDGIRNPGAGPIFVVP